MGESSLPDLSPDAQARGEHQGIAEESPPAHQIYAYQIPDNAPEIRRGSPTRAWMDASSDRFAYRCLPLVIANQYGWDLLNPTPFRARWLGGDRPTDLQVESLASAGEAISAETHFGNATLTFNMGYLFRTPPGIRLLVTGPPNMPKDGLYPFSGVVETDWTHASFTMNYLFTRPNHWVQFDAGEPFCRIVPVSVDTTEKLSGVITGLDEHSEVAHQYRAWSEARDGFNRALRNPFSSAKEVGWQKEYFQGRQANGTRHPEHQTQLHHKEFKDLRRRTAGSSTTSPARQDSPSGQASTRSAGRVRGQKADAFDYLWSDIRPFEARREKSAQVLVALSQTLERVRPLQGGEDIFLESFRRVSQVSAETFTDIWSEPQAYFWVRMAFQLVDALLNQAKLTPLAEDYCRELGCYESHEALTQHLASFRSFELGAAVLENRDCQFDPPLEVQLPFAIPATRWCIHGSEQTAISGFRAGQLQAMNKGRKVTASLADPSENTESNGCHVTRCSLVEFAGCRIRLQPEALDRLGIEAVTPAVSAGSSYQAVNRQLLTDTLEAINCYAPEVFEQIAGTMRLVGLKPQRPDEYSNVSISELPGAMLLTVINHPLAMADRMIHEYHHNRLFSMEDCESLLEPGSASITQQARFYSPWRDDPRPIKGVLHGLYVYIAVGRFWLAVHQARDRQVDRPYVVEQLLRIGKQLSLALDVLASDAQFTPLGEGAFEQIRTDVEQLHQSIHESDLPEDAPALVIEPDGTWRPELSRLTNRPLSVAESIDEHLELFSNNSLSQNRSS